MFCTVAGRSLAFGDIGQFAFYKLFADRRDTVCEDMRLQMVVLMQNDTRRKIGISIGMLIEILVLVTNSYRTRAHHILRYTRQ